MGTRTELFLRVELDEDLPDEVVAILDAYARGEAGVVEELPAQAFFETPGWDSALRHRDFATPTAREPVQFWMDEIDNPDQWRAAGALLQQEHQTGVRKVLGLDTALRGWRARGIPRLPH